MIFDRTLLFSNAQAIVADARSTNVVDLGAPGTVYKAAAALSIDRGKSVRIPLLIQIVEAFNTLTSMEIQVQVDNDEAFGSPKIVARQSLLLAELTVGKLITIRDMPEGVDERYMSIYYDITGTAPTLGKVTAGFVAARQTN